MAEPTVYILFSQKDGKTYTGSTTDLTKRFMKHESGHVKATTHRRPLKIIYTETFRDIGMARKRECYFKTTSGRRLLRKILKNIL